MNTYKSDGVPKTQSLSFNDAYQADHRKLVRPEKLHFFIMSHSTEFKQSSSFPNMAHQAAGTKKGPQGPFCVLHAGETPAGTI